MKLLLNKKLSYSAIALYGLLFVIAMGSYFADKHKLGIELLYFKSYKPNAYSGEIRQFPIYNGLSEADRLFNKVKELSFGPHQLNKLTFWPKNLEIMAVFEQGEHIVISTKISGFTPGTSYETELSVVENMLEKTDYTDLINGLDKNFRKDVLIYINGILLPQ